MTEKTDQCYAEATVHNDVNTGEKMILLRVFRNLKVEAVYGLEYLEVLETTTTSNKWDVLEKEND